MPPKSSLGQSRWIHDEGSSFPLGVSWIQTEEAYNFAIYSKHAHSVELCFFGPTRLTEIIHAFSFDPLKHKSGPIWHCRIPAMRISGAHYYAYRMGGPGPEEGFNWHAFDHEKLLLDPYASSVFFPASFDREAAREPGSNVGQAPLAVLQDPRQPATESQEETPPLRHEWDLVIYELHIGGFTRHQDSGVTESRRGTYSGVIDKIPYLLELGITAVELMPVFQFDPGTRDYWGYMPINFFSPHHGYASDPDSCNQDREFREMVRALHAAGIEVILDVVYNHSAEGDVHGPVYSFKGIDNSSYYMLTGNQEKPYANFSGTGNTIHTRNRVVRQLIIDSIRHWAIQAKVDGFRFDLASVFARNPDGSVSPDEPPIFGELASHPELSDVRLFAEPWDASGLFQLGDRFPGTLWRQWNSAYRDTLQRFLRGDPGLVGDLMTRIYGSSDYFSDEPGHAFHPFQSVNYFSSHDGLTLYDLISFNHKINWANGHSNADGAYDFSWNCGWEGDRNVPPSVLELRKRQARNFICILMLSNGTPMFRMGDEFLNSQRGNSNPYNQDNETSWLDWKKLDSNRDVFRFFRKMIAFRKSHPTISRSRFWRDDIQWFGPIGPPDLSTSSRQIAYRLSGTSQGDDDLYVMINGAPEAIDFELLDRDPDEWVLVIDTSANSPFDIVDHTKAQPAGLHPYTVEGRSIIVWLRRKR